MRDGSLVISKVIIGRGKVKVALCRLLIDFESLYINSDGILEPVDHVECITQVVQGRCVSWVKVESCLVGGNSRGVVCFDTEGIP